MGMLINGEWHNDADKSMIDGKYRREASPLESTLNDKTVQQLRDASDRFYLIASASCPWSHGAVLALTLAEMTDKIKIQWAGGPRVEGYGLLPGGPIPKRAAYQHLHQFYSATDPRYTGRATVPILWDAKQERIISNASADIIFVCDQLSETINLFPDNLATDIGALIQTIFDELSNAVYRAGKAEKQDEYDEAVDLVFKTMDDLELRLEGQSYLFGTVLTAADLRLFATLVRFDTVYATHFRCTKKRLTDYPELWRFTRRIYHMPGVKETVNFDEIRYGYYVNDGSHNPHNIVGQQPIVDWDDVSDL